MKRWFVGLNSIGKFFTQINPFHSPQELRKGLCWTNQLKCTLCPPLLFAFVPGLFYSVPESCRVGLADKNNRKFDIDTWVNLKKSRLFYLQTTNTKTGYFWCCWHSGGTFLKTNERYRYATSHSSGDNVPVFEKVRMNSSTHWNHRTRIRNSKNLLWSWLPSPKAPSRRIRSTYSGFFKYSCTNSCEFLTKTNSKSYCTYF